ncbi:MAG: T9SS type A sorting domain-containing protein [Bacteroidota bacterium]
MKKIVITLSLGILFTLNLMLHAQESQQVHIRVVQDVDGQVQTFDSTFSTEGAINVNELLEAQGIQVEVTDGEKREVRILKEGIDFDSTSGNMEFLSEEQQTQIEAIIEEARENGAETGDIRVFEVEMDEEINEEGASNIRVLKLGSSEGEMEEMQIRLEAEMKAAGMEEAEMERVMKTFETVRNQIEVEMGILEETDAKGEQVIHRMTIQVHVMYDLDEDEKEQLSSAGVSNLENTLQVEDLTFYPNPSNGQFNLAFFAKEKGDLSIRIMDAQGKSVYEERFPDFEGAYENQIDLTGIAKGVYFLQLVQNEQAINKKLVVQ